MRGAATREKMETPGGDSNPGPSGSNTCSRRMMTSSAPSSVSSVASLTQTLTVLLDAQLERQREAEDIAATVPLSRPTSPGLTLKYRREPDR